MSKLSRWLDSLGPSDFTTSNTTSSVYYIVNGLKIRLADHFTTNQKGSDLQIICPINNSSVYTVVIKEGLQVLGFSNLKDLKYFIETYSYINRIKKTSDELRKIDTIIIPEPDSIKESIVNNKHRTENNDRWSQLCSYLTKDVPKWKGLTVPQKSLCRALFSTNRAYSECVKLINDVTSAKNFSTEEMNDYFKPYLKN